MCQTLKASSTRDNAQMIERARKRLSKRAKRGFRGYPLATAALYGPDDRTATKLAVGIVPAEHADATELRRWFSEGADIRSDADIAEEVLAFVAAAGARSVVMTDTIIGCPHEEGIDYQGPTCPVCTFWAGRDRWTGERTLVPSSKALAQFRSGALLAQPALSLIPAPSAESGWLPRLIAGD